MNHAIRSWALWGALAACGTMMGCFGSSSDSATANGNGAAAVEFPEGDPSVPPELGGPGFTGDGWTSPNPGPLGDPAAVKGGAILSYIPIWPENLRVYGTGANTSFNRIVETLCYETLCDIDTRTREFIPKLASHWKISDDHMKFEFRINPKAHWSDGTPVTTADVIATYRLIMDETLVDPMSRESMSKLHEPVAKSKYLLEVECREKDWRNFISFMGLRILPAHEIGSITGKQYLDDYNFRYTATSGPYLVKPEDIKENESITITRRKDYWGDDEPINAGLNNFEKIRFVVIRDLRLAFDKACKGELDFYEVNTAKWWVEDLPGLEAVQQGHLIRQKVYTRYPSGFQGEAFNMRKPPLDDILVRKALAHLFDRKTMRVTSMPEMIEFLRIGDETTVIIGGRRLDLPTLGPGETRHSPDGFEWGYGGSGPAELARALLIAVCPADAAARHPACYQMFKEAFVAHVPTTWSMPTSMVRAWYVTWAATPFGHKVQEWIEARDTLKEVPDGA